MKTRKVKVEFEIETDRSLSEIRKDVMNCFDKQFGIVSHVTTGKIGSRCNWLTFRDAIPHIALLRVNLRSLQGIIKNQEHWDQSMYGLDEFERHLDLSLREKEGKG